MVNKAIILGSVGKDPEIRTTAGSQEVANFSVATSEKWIDKTTNEKKEKTEWHNITVWGGLVSVVKNYVKKGSKVYVEGQLETSKYTDQNGIEKYSTKIVLKGFNCKLELCGGNNSHNATSGTQEDQKPIDDNIDDDIPF